MIRPNLEAMDPNLPRHARPPARPPDTARRSPADLSSESRIRRFVLRYGWRAYALPVLVALTVAAVWLPAQGRARPASAGAVTTGPPTASAPARSGATVTPSPTPAPIRTSAGSLESELVSTDGQACLSNTRASFVLVSLTRQHIWACEGSRQVYSSPVTTGATAEGNGTPVGSWLVQSRETDRDLVGPGYSEFVRYWVPFDGDFGFHDASWQKTPFGSADYPTAGSHGCVHLPTAAMAWLYQWSQVGVTEVTVIA
jgi:lipoprotein-anchoring transpeptidase ErfK/SrfK